MVKKIYVGNLPFTLTSEQLADLFRPHGEVRSATVMIDRETGKPRGFGFVTMVDDAAAAKAIAALDGNMSNGRPLRVNEAREREAGPGGNSGPGPRNHGGAGGPGGDGAVRSAPRRDDAAPRSNPNFGPPAAPGGRRAGEGRRDERGPERDWSRKPKSPAKPDKPDDFGPRHRKGGGGSRNWDDVDDD